MNQATKIALSFLSGAAAMQAAAESAKRAYKTREKAQQALLPAFAAKCSGSFTTNEQGRHVWALTKGKGSKGTMRAKKALNRLLSLAFKGKKAKTSNKVSKVTRVAKLLAALTPLQIKRAVSMAREIQAQK